MWCKYRLLKAAMLPHQRISVILMAGGNKSLAATFSKCSVIVSQWIMLLIVALQTKAIPWALDLLDLLYTFKHIRAIQMEIIQHTNKNELEAENV